MMIARVIGMTLRVLGERKLTVLAAIFLPSAFLIATQTFTPWLAQAGFLFAFLPLIAYAWLAVAVHRTILLKEDFRIRWGWRETRFTVTLFGVWLGIAIATWFCIAAFESIGIPRSGIASIVFKLFVSAVILFWASQYFFIFPAIATDRKYSYTHSSVDTEENRIDAFVVVIITPVLLALIDIPAVFVSDPLLHLAIRSTLSVVSITFGVAMLTVLFRELASRR